MVSVHYIQKHILLELLKHPRLRFSDLIPENINNDQFNYHLKCLLKLDLVSKTDNYYQLTISGEEFISQIYPLNPYGVSQHTFKVGVKTVVLRTVDGQTEVLMQKRLRKPGYGNIEVMGGTVKKNEPILATAKRKLEVETGLIATFKYSGSLRVMKSESKGLPKGDTFFHLCYTKSTLGSLQAVTEYGENFWMNITQAIQHTKDDPYYIKPLHEMLVHFSKYPDSDFSFPFTEQSI